MFKLRIMSMLFIIAFSLNNIFAQDYHSIQLDGGIIFPSRSSKGGSTFIKYNYSLNQTFNFYIYTGYSFWDKFNVRADEIIPGQREPRKQRNHNLHSYSSDNHVLIPLYVGTKINLYNYNLFTAFLDFEIGYSYFNYNSYENIKIIDETTGELLSYDVDKSSKTEEKDNLIGTGIGAGITYPLTGTLDIILSYRINSNIKSGEFGLLSAEGTYSTLYTGLNLKL